MAAKKQKDKLVKKIQKKKTNRNPVLDKKMGAPKNADRTLTEEQKELGRLIGLGLKKSEVKEKLGFSTYQINEYLSLPKVIEIIEKYRDLKGQDRLTRYDNLWGDIETAALLELQKRIGGLTESKFPDTLLMQIVNRTFIQAAVREDPKEDKEEPKKLKVIKSVSENTGKTESIFTEEQEEQDEKEE